MDGPTLDHSDSDSGESWTLLDHYPALVEGAPNYTDTPIKSEKEKPETHEKDEDTDGISIISDSDPESSSPCQMHYETLYEEDQDFQHLSPCPFNLAVPDDQNNKDDSGLLSIDHGKHKTYVHRRNKRLSTVLNIIVLGSVITAAGVAIGHMWGAKSDCSMNTIPNVNNILSNLYKLQEENAYLHNKVKELTAMNNQQNSQFKGSKHNRCKKVFEGPLNNDNTVKSIKCVDDKVDFSGILHKKDSKLSEPTPENDFKENINTLKNIYLENKNWLDDEIVLRLQQENQSRKRVRKSQQASKLQKINEEKDSKLNSQNKETIVKGMVDDGQDVKSDTPKIISYADSLKTFNDMQKENEFKINNNATPYYANKRNKLKGEINEKVKESGIESPISEEEIVKDSRYVSPKFKQERKKKDRLKSYKKQKRRNKYEQWEMKGGFMKDYDDISVSPDPNIYNDPQSQEKIEKHIINKNPQNNEYLNQNCNVKLKKKKTLEHKNSRDDLNLSNSRIYRADMKRLEEGLFGGEANPAAWYFRRMHKREQCRTKANNTNQKFAKRNMNYKMKH